VTAQEEESESELVSRNPFLANELRALPNYSPGRSLANYSTAYETIFGAGGPLTSNFETLPSLRNFGETLADSGSGASPPGAPQNILAERVRAAMHNKVEPTK
jgi:hypothetical protein